jgi:hypothetical protein
MMGGSREGIMDLDLGVVRPRKKRLWVKGVGFGMRAGWFLLKVVVALALPFFLLVRGSVYAYQDLGWGTWSSLATGIFATVLLFLVYASMLWKRMTGKHRVPRLARRLLIGVVGGYAVYGLLYLSAANAKSPELREHYTALHPVMRIGASTFLLFDREAVVTDLGRTVEDYLRMGLPANETSLHFKLEDRFVHALDLRTVGRTERRNWMTAGYFRMMGFRTLRHVGTADHLHVSLPLGGVAGLGALAKRRVRMPTPA